MRANTRLHIHTVSPEGSAGARGVGIVALSISFHEQTKENLVCCFLIL